MNSEKEISLRTEKIKTIFQSSKEFCNKEDDLAIIISHLENTDPEFRSIAYEGASMALALKDLAAGNTLNHWRSLLEGPGSKHAVQAHAGLGWAFAEQGSSPLPFFETLGPLMPFCVLNGCGYYDGIFKQRQTIKNKKIPEAFHGQLLEAYDQGIGRSLWYSCNGNETKISEIIQTFSSDRHPALWRGIGIACIYVGGCDEIKLRSLLSCAGNYHTQLAVGAIFVARSRIQANTLTPDVELACRVWCNLSTQEALLLNLKSEPDVYSNPHDAYAMWISQMEKGVREAVGN